jgi:nicotinate-nucleotide adenylyltransferase
LALRGSEAVTRRVGVYGGTFDPVHNGHLSVAAALCEAFAFDLFLFVPAFVPPHKRAREITSPYHRYAMTVLATLGQGCPHAEKMRVSTVELEAPTRPYTVETLARLGEQQPGALLFFVMGADSFAEVTSWRAYERILGEYRIVVAARPGHDAETDAAAARLPAGLRSRVTDLRGGRRPEASELATPRIFLTDYVAVDVAATEVRQMARAGRSIADLVPPPVAGYIARYGLYESDERSDNTQPD